METKVEIHATIPHLPIEDHPHYYYAQEALEAIVQRFPKGAFNQIENTQNLGLKNEAILHDMQLYKEFMLELENSRRPSVLANKTKSLLLGNCELFVNYTIGLLKEKYPSSTRLFEGMYLDSHVALVIGRAPDSDPKDISSWGNAIICDLWSKQIYASGHFREKQRNEPPIPYYNRHVYTLPTGQEIEKLGQGGVHYLKGNPEIETHPVNRLIDQACIDWVKEDERCRREVRVIPVRPSIFQADPNTLSSSNKKTVLDSLNKLSGIGQWKANIKSGSIWLENITDVQATQILDVLRLTGAIAEIKLSRTAIDSKPIIICNGVSCLSIIEQAATKAENTLLQETVSCNNPC